MANCLLRRSHLHRGRPALAKSEPGQSHPPSSPVTRNIEGSQEDISRFLPNARRIGTIVPGNIVPVVVPFRHGLEGGHGDKSASSTPCTQNDARGGG